MVFIPHHERNLILLLAPDSFHIRNTALPSDSFHVGQGSERLSLVIMGYTGAKWSAYRPETNMERNLWGAIDFTLIIIRRAASRKLAQWLIPLGLLLSPFAGAINNNVETTLPQLAEGENAGRFIPYAFYNGDTGLAVATVFMGKGYIQDQVFSVANVWAGQDGSYQFFWANTDAVLPFTDRLFIDSALMYTNWDEVDTYQDGSLDFPDEVAGSNDSDEDNLSPPRGTICSAMSPCATCCQ